MPRQHCGTSAIPADTVRVGSPNCSWRPVAHASAVDRALLWLALPGLVAAFDLAVNDPLGPEALARATGGGV
jgi:hypothetical protein